MARPHPVTVVCAALLALAPLAAPAQSALRTLHVDALAMRADRPVVHVGETFHLAIHVRVRENVTALDELVVPDVGTMHLLGDERATTHGPGGTDVVETLTLEPAAAGRATFAPAYLDAIDARTHRPSRFSSNPLTVRVLDGAAGGARGVAPLLLLAAVVLLFVLALALGRRRPRRERPVVILAPPVVPTARERVAEALRVFRVAPGASSVLALRAELFAAAAAPAGATLRDALASTADLRLRDALRAAEHAAFGPADVRDGAAAALADTTETWLR